ncbi:MAG: type II toxin-antitoxin system RelE/ParE family toxin [Elusimicrobia bacterium]|nr:type II toxin-antitoxin system RelE/ParE family toxin [Elusimicrobiota bacterium]
MKRRPVVYLPSAQRDLLEAVEYIRQDNPSAAEKWLERVDKALSRLGSFPQSGALPKDPRLARLGYRMLVIGEHLAFYSARPRVVEIRRVLHGRRRYSFLA